MKPSFSKETAMKRTAAALACLGSLLAAAAVPAAAASGKAGTTAGEFLRLAAGARPAAMGEAFTALADDAHALYFNPAGLAKVRARNALLSHTLWYVDVNHEYLAYVQPLNGRGGAGLSVTYLSTTFEKRAGDTETADSNGSVGELALAAGYGRELFWGIDGGLTLKYLSSDLDGTAAASVAFDLGFRKALRGDKLLLGLAARNLGGGLRYLSDTVALGNTVALGAASRDAALKGLTLALEYENVINGDAPSVDFGAEYRWDVNRDWALSPRAGFKSNGSVVTAGLGIDFKAYRFDYALNTRSSLGLSNRISFSVGF